MRWVGPVFMRDKMKAVTRAHTQDHRLIDLVLFSNIAGDFSPWFPSGLHDICKSHESRCTREKYETQAWNKHRGPRGLCTTWFPINPLNHKIAAAFCLRGQDKLALGPVTCYAERSPWKHIRSGQGDEVHRGHVTLHSTASRAQQPYYPFCQRGQEMVPSEERRL